MHTIPFLTDHDISSLLDPSSLVSALRDVFADHGEAPPRAHYTLHSHSGTDPDTLLLMPAWNSRYLGVKVATIHPENGKSSLPAVHATYLLKDVATGQDLAFLDGQTLTRLRTAAASALASSFLSRQDATTLLMIGAGALAAPLIEAHKAVRPIHRVLVWNRSPERIKALERLVDCPLERVTDLGSAVAEADIISCATLSVQPLFEGSHIAPGTHIDLVGAYRPDMRECDASTVERSRVFVDTYAGAREEAGDLIQAVHDGDWSMALIESDLAGLCRGKHSGRQDYDDITLFKSVGASLEDLAAAVLAWEKYQRMD